MCLQICVCMCVHQDKRAHQWPGQHTAESICIVEPFYHAGTPKGTPTVHLLGEKLPHHANSTSHYAKLNYTDHSLILLRVLFFLAVINMNTWGGMAIQVADLRLTPTEPSYIPTCTLDISKLGLYCIYVSLCFSPAGRRGPGPAGARTCIYNTWLSKVHMTHGFRCPNAFVWITAQGPGGGLWTQ